jgi:putative molybdopterin biosynthesis protein
VNRRAKPEDALIDAVRRAARQEQFLEVVSAEEASRRFHRHLDLAPRGVETVTLAASLGRVMSHAVVAPIDVPPFDRSGVDGFAIRAADSAGASSTSPRRFVLNPEVIACGHAPQIEVLPGTATALATGAVIPRGADAVVMIEHTELLDPAQSLEIELRRAAAPGQFISYAGSDMARGETLLQASTVLGSREIGMLAACGIAQVDVVRRPKVAVLSTGDELVPVGTTLPPAGVYDSNSAIVASAVTEAGGHAVNYGAFPDDETALKTAMQRALSENDMLVLSGGTSKGAGDLSHRIVSQLGEPGILVHGVALKPGKPLCLAVADNKPVVVLPGFPTSAIFTFHAFVAPVIRALAGLPAENSQKVPARIPVQVPSELGRKEFALVSLVQGEDGMIAFPSVKGSGAVTAFSQADGFIEIDALAGAVDADTIADVTLIGPATRAPDLVIMGSHDVALDVLVSALADQGFHARVIAVGSLGGVAAARRGECDIAPVHLIDPETGNYNTHLIENGLSLLKGWRRSQGFLYRQSDKRFEGKSADAAIAAALADASCLMVNRNAGSGTRVLTDQKLKGMRPPGYANQPKSHNAVAAAIAQGRADWGLAIEPVARMYGLGFLPIAPEEYDFIVVERWRDRPALRAFRALLKDDEIRRRIAALGMTPSDQNAIRPN